MVSEIAVRQDQANELSTVDADAYDLITWARAAQQAYQIATRLAETSFVPKAMQRRPDEITGAILAGRELGLSPMSALRSFDIIDGTPAMRAHTMRGLVQAHGHEVWVEESTEHRAVICGQRRKRGLLGSVDAGRVSRSVWTMDRARKAGLANKRNWQTHPTAMLVARATAEVCRLIAADVLLGMPYAVEELSGEHVPELAELPDEAPKLAAAARKRTAKRAPLASAEQPAPEPQNDEDKDDEDKDDVEAFLMLRGRHAPENREPKPETAPEKTDGSLCIISVQKAGEDPQPCGLELPCPQHEGEPITDRQRRALMAAYTRAGLGSRELRLGHASRIVGRPLASSNDLSKREAGLLLDVLALANSGPTDEEEPPQEGEPG